MRARLIPLVLAGRLQRLALLTIALGVLAVPGALAQDAGVSGIAPGPGNARGLNGSVNDPSGIGNAATAPAVAPPAASESARDGAATPGAR